MNDHVAPKTTHGEMVDGEVKYRYAVETDNNFRPGIPAHPSEHWFGETSFSFYHERASRFWDRWYDDRE